MNKDEYEKFLEAVDVVCINCAEDTLDNPDVCDSCPVRNTCDIKIYNSFPTMEQIKSDYYELLELIKDIKTIEQAQEFEQKTRMEIEINGWLINEYVERGGTNEGIEWIRYDNFGCLDYIYNHLYNKYIMFDVYSEFCDYDFIEDITIDKLTEEFLEKAIKKAINNKL